KHRREREHEQLEPRRHSNSPPPSALKRQSDGRTLQAESHDQRHAKSLRHGTVTCATPKSTPHRFEDQFVNRRRVARAPRELRAHPLASQFLASLGETPRLLLRPTANDGGRCAATCGVRPCVLRTFQ